LGATSKKMKKVKTGNSEAKSLINKLTDNLPAMLLKKTTTISVM